MIIWEWLPVAWLGYMRLPITWMFLAVGVAAFALLPVSVFL